VCRLRRFELLKDLRIGNRTTFTRDGEGLGHMQDTLITLASKAILAEGEKALAGALHTVVPGVALNFVRRDREHRHRGAS